MDGLAITLVRSLCQAIVGLFLQFSEGRQASFAFEFDAHRDALVRAINMIDVELNDGAPERACGRARRAFSFVGIWSGAQLTEPRVWSTACEQVHHEVHDQRQQQARE
jgi:hypothetical protein